MVQLLPTQRSRTTYQHNRKNDMSQNELLPLPECDALTVGLGPMWNRHSMEAYARAAIAAQAGQSEPALLRQPLTDEEIIHIAKQTKTAEPGRDGHILPISFARAIEAKITGAMP